MLLATTVIFALYSIIPAKEITIEAPAALQQQAAVGRLPEREQPTARLISHACRLLLRFGSCEGVGIT